MNIDKRRIAINVGAGYVPGINAVIMGAALAAGKLGWEVVGIRDGFDGLFHRDRYDGDISLQWKAWNAGLYGFQQRETYGSGENDAWDELGLILRTQRTAGSWGKKKSWRRSA